MDEQAWVTQLLSSTQGQYIIGVIVLIFGSKAILSEKTIREKFSGIHYISKKLQERQQRAAEQESQATRKVIQVNKYQHEYIVHLTQYLHRVELKAAREGWDMPVPKVEDFYLFQERALGKEKSEVGADRKSSVDHRPDVDDG